jgi:hypothetical protein
LDLLRAGVVNRQREDKGATLFADGLGPIIRDQSIIGEEMDIARGEGRAGRRTRG